MPFLGNEPSNTFVSIAKQTITGNGGTSYTLSYAVTSANDIDVFYNNVRQEPGVAYTASGTTITFTEAIVSTDSVYVLYNNQAIGTINPPSGSVGVGQLNTTEVDARYVNVSGDTMTNGLTINENTFGCNVRLKNDGTGGKDWYLFSTSDVFAQGGGKLMAFNSNATVGSSYQWGVDSLGRVTTPYQPAFVVTKNGGASGTLSANTVLDFSYPILNRGGYYNTSTYRFTAPVAGYYMFYVHLYHQLSAGGVTRIMIKKNGSEIYQGTDVIPHAFVQTNSAGAGDYSSSTSIIYELAVNDYVNVAVRNGQTGQWYGGHSLFYGYLLG